MNIAIPNHPAIGQRVTFRPDLPPYRDSDNPSAVGRIVAGHGHTLKVLEVYDNWNGIRGLRIFYCLVEETGMRTHFSADEINDPRLKA